MAVERTPRGNAAPSRRRRLGLPRLATFSLAALCLAGTLGIWAPGVRAAQAPQISNSYVTDVTASSVNLRAEINPEGSPSTYRFDYIPDSAYAENIASGKDGFTGALSVPPLGGALGGGSAVLSVVQHLSGLSSTTGYRYRARASNSNGDVASTARVFTTEAPTNAFALPDARAWELVSDASSAGGAIVSPEGLFGGGAFQAAAQGSALTYSTPIAPEDALSSPPASQLLSMRGAAGWSTQSLSPPTISGGYGDHPDGVPFRVFSEDLSHALMLNGARCTVEGTCPPSYSLWAAGTFSTLPTRPGLKLVGSTPDLSHAVFAAEGGLYEWGGGSLETIAPGPGASLAAPLGALSEDGRRLYWSQLEDGPIWLHETGQPDTALPETVGVGAVFQTASADGSIAFYTAGADLYRFQVGSGTSSQIASGVEGVLGASADGMSVFFQSTDGLKRWSSGATTVLVSGANAARSGDYLRTAATARVSADGSHLAFLSGRELTPYDNAGRTELYLYGAPPSGGAPELLCVSCNSTGERPRGSASIPGALPNGSLAIYRPRVLASSGARVFFESTDALVQQDTDNAADVYQWEAQGSGDCERPSGCLALISKGRESGGASFLDASADGDDVYFLTEDSLVHSDPGARDIYDARVGGGIAEAPAPFECKGDACQPLPSPPDDPTPATTVPNAGNPPPRYFKERHRRHHRPHRKKRKHRTRRISSSAGGIK